MYLITGFILLLNLNFVNLATTICYVKKASVRQVFHSLEEGRHVSLVLFVALAFLFIFTVRQYIREADREWEVQPRKFRRPLDMSSEPVFDLRPCFLPCFRNPPHLPFLCRCTLGFWAYYVSVK